MRSPVWLRRTSAIAVLLASAVPIIFFASHQDAAVILAAVTLGGIAGGLAIQALLNRRYMGRSRLVFRLPRYVVPADLPPPPGVFVGRDHELLAISNLLGADRSADGLPVVAITGGEGVGKTALAVTAAHLVAQNFPDGQILVRFDTQRPDGNELIREYLTRALKASTEQPPASRQFDRWYRRNTYHKRLLVVLDNVPDNVDVPRFLPAGSQCAAMVISRRPLKSLSARLSIELNPLTAPADTQLLLALLGDRAGLEPGQIDKAVDAAGGYPAALQMAGAVARIRRRWDLDVAFDEAQRLTEVAEGEPPPQFAGILNLACALLTEQERQCLALLALPRTRRVHPWMLTVLAEIAFPGWEAFDELTAARVLDRLSRLRFTEIRVDEQSGVTAYRIPAYVQAYARILLAAEVAHETAEHATTRLDEVSRARLERTPAETARREVYHLLDLGRLNEAMAAARANLHLCHGRVEAAASADELRDAQEDEHRAELVLAEVFAELGWLDDAITYTRSSDDGGRWAQVRALRIRGRVRWRLRQRAAAIDALTEAHNMAEPLDADPAEQIRILRELTIAHAFSGDPKPALDYAQRAVGLTEVHARQLRRLPSVLWAYGIALMADGRLDAADEVLAEGDLVSGDEDLEQALWRPWIRHQRALVALAGGRFDDARGFASSALSGFTSLIHRYGSGHCRQVIGRAYLAERDFERAVPSLEEALQTFERCGDPWIGADTAYWLGLAYRGLPKRAEDAAPTLRMALAAFEALDKDSAGANRCRAALKELGGSLRGRRRTERDTAEPPSVPV